MDDFVMFRCLQMQTDGLAGQGRNPFPSVEQGRCRLTNNEEWLYRGPRQTWQIGDNVEYPGELLYVRAVSKAMFEFIREHFESEGVDIHFCQKIDLQ